MVTVFDRTNFTTHATDTQLTLNPWQVAKAMITDRISDGVNAIASVRLFLQSVRPFLPRDAMLARYMLWPFVCVSV